MAQLSLRIGQADLDRVREALLASGETVARFVREAVRDKGRAVEEQRRHDAGTSFAETTDQPSRVERLVLAAVTLHLGLKSIAAVAAAAGVSWSSARDALNTMATRGTVRFRAVEQCARIGAREAGVWEPAVASADFDQLISQTKGVSLPPASPSTQAATRNLIENALAHRHRVPQ